MQKIYILSLFMFYITVSTSYIKGLSILHYYLHMKQLHFQILIKSLLIN